MENYLYPTDNQFLSSEVQLLLVVLLFIVMVFVRHRSDLPHKDSYSINLTYYFAPIYEEILFRGVILPYFLTNNTVAVSILISSILFGIWHLKNIEHMSKQELIYQMLYAGLIIGPLLGYLTVVTGTIWIGVILHYANNILSIYTRPYWLKLLKKA